MRTVWTLLTLIVVLGVTVIAFAYSGLYDVSARSAHSAPVSWLLSTTSESAIRRQGSLITVPDLSKEELISAGINDYEAMCANCHGAPGRSPSAMALGLNPRAPDLSRSARAKSAGELFWVTKHGIKMTGMPAWGATHDDAALWPVVAFMTRLPELDGPAYRELLADASGMGHHTNDSDLADASGHDHPDVTGQNGKSSDHQDGAVGDHHGNDEAGAMTQDNDKSNHVGHDHKH